MRPAFVVKPPVDREADGVAQFQLQLAIADKGILHNLASAPCHYAIDDAVHFATQEHDTHYPTFLLMLRTHCAPRLIGVSSIRKHDRGSELG